MTTKDTLITLAERFPEADAADLACFLWQKHFGAEDARGTDDGKNGSVLLSDSLMLVWGTIPGFSAEMLDRLAEMTPRFLDGDMQGYRGDIACLQALYAEKRLSGGGGAWLIAYRAAGCPKPRHTARFLRCMPKVRIVPAAAAEYAELFSVTGKMIRERGRVLMAIDGCSCSGKSTLAELLAAAYRGTVVHMDDFFLRPGQRTAERYAEPGGNVDRERFCEEAVPGLAAGQAFSYRKFDCRTMKPGGTVRIPETALTIVEGAYCMHPGIPLRYDKSIFLGVDPVTQYERLLKRNGETAARRFLEKWIPLENAYFSGCDVMRRCDTVYLHTKGENSDEL